MRKYFTKLKSPFFITLILISFTLIFSDYHFRWKNEQWKGAVNTDAYFYYHYLPSVFITHHLDTPEQNSKTIKYFIGTAIFEAPFFALACFFSFLLHYPIDGYSILFPFFISLATLFYLLWGLYFFGKFLRFYFIPEWIICVATFALAFCTNIFYNTVVAPGWCHIIAFGLVCFLLYHIKKLFVWFNTRSLLFIIATTSFLFFVRPTDVLILLIAPFLAEGKTNLRETLKNIIAKKRTIGIGLLIATIPLLCQILIYKVSTGHFFVWSYTGEGFHFLNPEIKNVLFSYSKGLFVYTPICFLSLFGLIGVHKINRFLFSGIIITLAINAYVISSWWCWNFGYSFGARAFIEQFPIYFLLFAFLLTTINKKILKISIFSVIMLLAFLNLFQTYQAERGILDKDFKTNAKGYWNVFLKTRGCSEKYFRFPVDSSKSNMEREMVWFNDMEKKDDTWINQPTITNENVHSGKYSSKVNSQSNYSVGLIKKINEIPFSKNVLIRVSGWFCLTGKGSNSFFAINFAKGGKGINFNTFFLDERMEEYGKWEYQTFEMYMPNLNYYKTNLADTQIEFYCFNNSEVNCFVDDLDIEIIEYKKLERLLDISWAVH